MFYSFPVITFPHAKFVFRKHFHHCSFFLCIILAHPLAKLFSDDKSISSYINKIKLFRCYFFFDLFLYYNFLSQYDNLEWQLLPDDHDYYHSLVTAYLHLICIVALKLFFSNAIIIMIFF